MPTPPRLLWLSLSLDLMLVAPCAAQEVEASTNAPVSSAVLSAAFAPKADEVFAHVEHLANADLRGRRAGSQEGAKAAKYIAGVFEDLGLEPAGDGDGFEQPFERMMALRTKPDPEGEGESWTAAKVVYRNVLGWLPGSDPAVADEYVLIGAHFDHLGERDGEVHLGADDNASGTAAMLAIARACAEGSPRPRRSVLFAAFDGEERGLEGSRYFVRHSPRSLEKLVAMINLDMLGRGTFYDQKRMGPLKKAMRIPEGMAVGVLGTSYSPELAAIARAVCGADELPIVVPEDYPLLQRFIEKQSKGRSDHAPFEQLEIPYLFFSTGESDDYHRPTDTVDKVDAQALWRITRCVYRVVLAIAERDERPTFGTEK